MENINESQIKPLILSQVNRISSSRNIIKTNVNLYVEW